MKEYYEEKVEQQTLTVELIKIGFKRKLVDLANACVDEVDVEKIKSIIDEIVMCKESIISAEKELKYYQDNLAKEIEKGE